MSIASTENVCPNNNNSQKKKKTLKKNDEKMCNSFPDVTWYASFLYFLCTKNTEKKIYNKMQRNRTGGKEWLAFFSSSSSGIFFFLLE